MQWKAIFHLSCLQVQHIARVTGCLCRSSVVATGDNHWAMRCFEVLHNFAFVCFANGKLAIYNMDAMELARKPFAAHTSEIKHIVRGHGDTVVTSCLDNSIRTWSCELGKLQTEEPLGPVAICNDATKQVDTVLPLMSAANGKAKVCSTHI